jgi:hypothetical protein
LLDAPPLSTLWIRALKGLVMMLLLLLLLLLVLQQGWTTIIPAIRVLKRQSSHGTCRTELT